MIRYLLALTYACLLLTTSHAAVDNGRISLSGEALNPGTATDITGQWLYKPGPGLSAGEKPEQEKSDEGYLRIGVPQFLCETRAWLDDSEDYKQFEQARLAKLGFDTTKVNDGWYRLWIDVPRLEASKHVFIEFEGVAMKCRAYVNGHLLGEHAGMFSRFSFDLTKHLAPGPNLFALYVSMENIPSQELSLGSAVSVNLTASKVKSMSKGMFGPLVPEQDNRAYDLHGIWQPVKLVVRDSAMLRDVWFRPGLSGADVEVEASSLGEKQDLVVHARWSDASSEDLESGGPKQVTWETSSTLSLSALASDTKPASVSLKLTDISPRHWTPAEPNLYRLDVTLETVGGLVLDSWSQKVGFRTFEARGKQLYLNGKPYWLRGSNHLPYGKNPWDKELPRKLIQAMHDNNQRITRTHCIPWNEHWLQCADEIGLGVSIEGFRPWAFAGKIGATPPDLFQHWLMENEDLIRRCRNHPSVLIYTIGNELLLRDHENMEKWQQLSDVVKQTRRLDPSLPVVSSSSYVRNPKLYDETLKPAGIDDGDIDDIHTYKGWYESSPFVDEGLTKRERGSNKYERPFIGQEVSTGYPDLDLGLPVFRYTRDILNPQAWVGEHAYPGNDPTWFLQHVGAVTKRWQEKLRWEREQRETAGFLMFATECWFRHSYDSETMEFYYPIIHAARDGWAPVGLALETGKRRFYAGSAESTDVHITNDDDKFRDFSNARLLVRFEDEEIHEPIGKTYEFPVGELKYYSSKKLPVKFDVPGVNEEELAGATRRRMHLALILMEGDEEVSKSVDPVEVFPIDLPQRSELRAVATIIGLGRNMEQIVRTSKVFDEIRDTLDAADQTSHAIFIGPKRSLAELSTGGAVRAAVEAGATAVVFSPGSRIVNLFPDDIMSTKSVIGEFGDVAPLAGIEMTRGLEPMDVKWWTREGDSRMLVARECHRLRPGGTAREMVRFVPTHGYIREDRMAEQFQVVMFELHVGKGRVWVCDLDLESSVGVDPAARLFAYNLLRSAGDPESTDRLLRIAGHFQRFPGSGVKPLPEGR